MNEIAYKLTFEEGDDYLSACIEADSVSFEMIIEYTNKIVQRLKESSHNRLLLVNESPVLPSTDCYVIASYIVKNAISANVKIAVVDKYPGNSRKQAQITQHSRAAGLDTESFSDVEQAEVWLLAQEERSTGGG